MSVDPPGVAAAPDHETTIPASGDGASDGASASAALAEPASRFRPATTSRRFRVPRAIADRFNPTPMPESPPVLDSPAAAPLVPSRQVDLPPAPPTRPLSESEQAAATQAARAAQARAAAVSPVIAAPTAASLAAARTEAPPAPVPAPAPVPVPPARPPRPARALPPGETGMLVEEVAGERLSRREQKQLGRLRARKVCRVIRHIEPWSVFKLSLLFYLCLFIVFMVAGTLMWNLATTAGTIDNVLNFLNDLGGGELTIEARVIFRAALYGGLVMVIAGSLFNVLLVVLVNLISDLVGGIRVTVIEEERVRRGPPASRSAARPTR